MQVSLVELRDLARRAILAYGYSIQDAETILDILMYAQMRGNNQGVVKLIGPGIPRSRDAGPIEVSRRGESIALINGSRNHAMVVIYRAVQEAVSIVSQSGVAVVGVRGINTSSGAIGYYARQIASAGYVGIVFAGASPVVAPEGSYEPIYGTNPISIAVPTADEPVVLDMATAAMAFFGVVEAITAGRDLPDGTAYDSVGAETNDASRALEGALRTFDRGRKGSGLSFMVQALTGPLVGASYAGVGDVDGNWGGHLVVALDPEVMMGLDAMTVGVSAIVERVHQATRLSNAEEVLVPGERGDRMARNCVASGSVNIDEDLFAALCEVVSASS